MSPFERSKFPQTFTFKKLRLFHLFLYIFNSIKICNHHLKIIIHQLGKLAIDENVLSEV